MTNKSIEIEGKINLVDCTQPLMEVLNKRKSNRGGIVFYLVIINWFGSPFEVAIMIQFLKHNEIMKELSHFRLSKWR